MLTQSVRGQHQGDRRFLEKRLPSFTMTLGVQQFR
jgi:hypothetical protein